LQFRPADDVVLPGLLVPTVPALSISIEISPELFIVH